MLVVRAQAALQAAGSVPPVARLGRGHAAHQPLLPLGAGVRLEGLGYGDGQFGRQARIALPVAEQPVGGPFDLGAQGLQVAPVLDAAQLQVVQVALPMTGVGQPRRLFLGGTGLRQPPACVLSQQVVHPPDVVRYFLHQAGVFQALQRLAGPALVIFPHRLDSGECELATGKDSQAAQAGLILWGEIVVAGVEGDEHAEVGPVALVEHAGAAGTQLRQQRSQGPLGGLVLARSDALGAAGGQSEGQRHVLQQPGDLPHRLRLTVQPGLRQQGGQERPGLLRLQHVEAADGLWPGRGRS